MNGYFADASGTEKDDARGENPFPADECRDCPALIRERDEAQEWADELADLIAAITGANIGEHSNLNNPWERAAEAADAYLNRSK